MKVMNFPERKRQRQLRALDRLAGRWQKTDNAKCNVEIERQRLTERTAANRRNERTKKYRGVRRVERK